MIDPRLRNKLETTKMKAESIVDALLENIIDESENGNDVLYSLEQLKSLASGDNLVEALVERAVEKLRDKVYSRAF